MDLTIEEVKLIRKALQIVLMAHICIETNDGVQYRDTKVDALLKRFREVEENGEILGRNTDPGEDADIQERSN